jgi:hypothetical protein
MTLKKSQRHGHPLASNEPKWHNRAITSDDVYIWNGSHVFCQGGNTEHVSIRLAGVTMHAMKGAFVTIFAATVLVALVVRAQTAGEWDDDDFTSLPESQQRSMPDKDDTLVREQLRCSVCHWCAVELHGDAKALDAQAAKASSSTSASRKRHASASAQDPSQDAIDDMFDEFCDRHYPNYGLHVDAQSNTVKPKYTKLVGRVQGAWVTRLFHNECSAFLAQFQSNATKRRWKFITGLWSGTEHTNSIPQEKFEALCPACRSENGRKGYPTRDEGLMWVNEATRIEEDWDL